ncbi:unnamed protein product [Linum tenue]|uniref:Uncharacterized protein n=1 Tax=Linum tenue TaxID=586396 RepID=A0AAV0MS06_9ROSI|nr:unnamed protein product [Linum tenue]
MELFFTPTPVFIAKKEHIFGRNFYGAKPQFCGDGRDCMMVAIECDTVDMLKDPCLVLRVYSEVVMQIRRLKWKLRNNGTILVDDSPRPVEVVWDVMTGCWVVQMFKFQTCVSAEKLWNGLPMFDPSALTMSESQRFRDYQIQGQDEPEKLLPPPPFLFFQNLKMGTLSPFLPLPCPLVCSPQSRSCCLPSSTLQTWRRYPLKKPLNPSRAVVVVHGGRNNAGVPPPDGSQYMDKNGVVEDMDGYLNYLSLEYDSVWDTKPSW